MAGARPAFDRRELCGPFDIIGDVHGCCDELETLLAQLGYDVVWSAGDVRVTPPTGRTLVFVGDLVDRGPRTPDVLRIAMSMAATGASLCVQGNHDRKLARWLSGARVSRDHGLQASIDQLEQEAPDFQARARTFLTGLPAYLWLDKGRLLVAHAGLRRDMAGRDDERVRAFALYGDTTGEVDGYGAPVRRNWALEHDGDPAIVYGHVAARSVQAVNNTWCLDTGCCFGGTLSALRWPERELVDAPALKVYVVPRRPLADGAR